MGLSYIHVMRSAGFDSAPLRPLFNGPFLLGGGFEGNTAEAMLARGDADAIVFGKWFISNPDFPARLQTGAPLAQGDQATFYTPGARGYTDYPALPA